MLLQILKKIYLEDTGSIDCQYFLAAPPLSSENGHQLVIKNKEARRPLHDHIIIWVKFYSFHLCICTCCYICSNTLSFSPIWQSLTHPLSPNPSVISFVRNIPRSPGRVSDISLVLLKHTVHVPLLYCMTSIYWSFCLSLDSEHLHIVSLNNCIKWIKNQMGYLCECHGNQGSISLDPKVTQLRTLRKYLLSK